MAKRKRVGALKITVRARVPKQVSDRIKADARRSERSESYVLRKIIDEHYARSESVAA